MENNIIVYEEVGYGIDNDYNPETLIWKFDKYGVFISTENKG